jgi:hypothetical protein
MTTVSWRPGLRADDSVDAEVEVLLQLSHRRFGLGAKASVDAAGIEADRAHPILPAADGEPVAPGFNTGWLWSVNKGADPTGHAMGLCGIVVAERLDPSGFSLDPDLLANGSVVRERALDSDKTHSCAPLSARLCRGNGSVSRFAGEDGG